MPQIVVVLFFLSIFACAQAGDLPEEAILKLGSSRFTHSHGIYRFGFLKGGSQIFADFSEGLCIWDLKSGKRVWEMQPPKGERRIHGRLSEDGAVAIIWSGAQVGIMQTDRPGEIEWHPAFGAGVLGIDAKAATALSGRDGDIVVWSPALNSLARHIAAPTAVVALCPTGIHLAACGEDKEAATGVWRTETAERITTIPGRTEALRFSNHGKMLACDTEIRNGNTTTTVLRLIDIPSGRLLWELPRNSGSFAFSPDDTILAATGHKGINIIDTATGQVVREIARSPTSSIGHLAFSPDGRTLAATGGATGTIRCWDTQDWIEQYPSIGHMGPVTQLAISPNGRFVASGGDDATIRIWDAASGKEKCVLRFGDEAGAVTKLAFSPDSSKLAGYGSDRLNTVGVWRVETGELVCKVKGAGAAVAFMPGTGELLTGSYREGLRAWDAETGKFLRQVCPGDFYDLLILPTRTTAIYEDSGGKLRRFSLISGEESEPIEATYRGTVLSPCGTWIAANGKAWDIETNEEILAMPYHEETVFSPDGRFLVWLRDKRIHVWDRVRKMESYVYKDEGSETTAMQFSPDGKTLVSGHRDGSVLIRDFSRVLAKIASAENRGPVRQSTLEAFQALADLPFINYGAVINGSEPQHPDAQESWKRLCDFLVIDWPRSELEILLDHPVAETRTLALLKLYTLEDQKCLPLIYSKVWDNTLTFPSQTDPEPQRPPSALTAESARLLGVTATEEPKQEEKSIKPSKITVNQLGKWMLRTMGYPRSWGEDRDSESFEDWSVGRVDNPDWLEWQEFLYKRASASWHERNSKIGAYREKLNKESLPLRAWMLFAQANGYSDHYVSTLATETEAVAVARQLGSKALLAFLRDGTRAGLANPKVDDPEKGRRFILDHRRQLFGKEDAEELASLGLFIAASEADPSMASKWIRQALITWTSDHRSWDRAYAVAALLDLVGDAEADFAVECFYRELNDTQGSTWQSSFISEVSRRKVKAWRKALAAIVAHRDFDRLKCSDITSLVLCTRELSGKGLVEQSLLRDEHEVELRNVLRRYFGVPTVVKKLLTAGSKVLEQPQWRTPFAGSAGRMVLSPDGRRLAVGLSQGGALLVDAGNGQLIAELPVAGHDTGVHFRKNGNLITFNQRSEMTEWSPDGRWIDAPKATSPPTREFEREGFEDTQNILGSWESDIREIAKARDYPDLLGNMDLQHLRVVAISPNCERMLLGTHGSREMLLWNPAARKPVARLDKHPGERRRVCFSTDGKLLATTGDDTRVLIWETKSGNLLHEYINRWPQFGALAFTADSLLIARCGQEIYGVFDIETEEPRVTYKTPGNTPERCIPSRDGKHLYMLVAIYEGDGITKPMKSSGRIDCLPLRPDAAARP